MGNQTSVMNSDKFKDQVFSLVLYHMAQKANPDFRFTLKDNCTPDQLPAPENNDFQTLLNCYKTNDQQVSAYLDKHVLNKEENLARFYQTLIGHLRSNQPQQEFIPKKGEVKQPLTRSQIERLDQQKPKQHKDQKADQNKERNKDQTEHLNKSNEHSKPKKGGQKDKSNYSTFKDGEYLNDGDVVSVRFPEANQDQIDLYRVLYQQAKTKLFDSLMDGGSDKTRASEIERQIDAELDQEFADLDNVDFDKLDLETIRSRIVDRQQQGNKTYPMETNYKPQTTKNQQQNQQQNNQETPSLNRKLDDVYYQPNKGSNKATNVNQNKKGFGKICMIED